MTTSDVELRYLPLDELLASTSANNPKLHATGAIGRSIARFGMVGVPLRTRSGETFVGRGRLEALGAAHAAGESPPRGIRVDATGAWLVPTLVGFELDETEAAAYRLADNQLPAVGGWDEVALTAQLRELAELASWRLDGTGFTTVDLDHLIQKWDLPTVEADPDEVPELPSDDDLQVQLGDLWALGRHQILCGDSTDATALERLLGDHRPAVAFTDPPYNVNYGRHSGAAGRTRRSILNDHMTPEEWTVFVGAWSMQLMTHVDGAIYVCMSSREWPSVARLLAEAGGHWSDTIIWSKDQFTLGRSDFQRAYEPIWYGWREGAKHEWLGGRAQSDVWAFPRPRRNELHPTQKPVALIEHALGLSSRQGDIVLDPFLGSGSTLIAADRLERACFGIELDPKFVQVTIRRWERLSGASAVRTEGDA